MRVLTAVAVLIAAAVPARADTGERVRVGAFSIDRTEVTIGAFEAFATARGLRTAAERAGGGFEYDGRWVRRAGWTFRAPSGRPGTPQDPAAHVTWSEANDYCRSVGGRLPSLAEWRQAAFIESRESPTDGFSRGRTYPFAVGEQPAGMNLSGANGGPSDVWERHAPVGSTKRGVNGLFDMGGNVWEWLSDRRGDEAVTAGGSWWYGPAQSRADGVQWKAADFYAVYVGFRCAYDG